MSGRVQRPGVNRSLGVHEERMRGLERGLVDLSWGLFSANNPLTASGITVVEYDTFATNADETFELDAGTGRANILAEGAYLFFESAAIFALAAISETALMTNFHTADSFTSLPPGIFTPFHGQANVLGRPAGFGNVWTPNLIEMRVYNDDGIAFPAYQYEEFNLSFTPGENSVSTLIVRMSNPT